MIDIELEVMAHRYLYFVLLRPVISNKEYDALQKEAMKQLPASSPVHLYGSDKESDYQSAWVARARILLSSAPHSWSN